MLVFSSLTRRPSPFSGQIRLIRVTGCSQWFKRKTAGPPLGRPALSVPLQVIWFPFKWHLSASGSRPTGRASGWGTAGAGEPAARQAPQAPTAEARDREAPPFFLGQKATHEQGWQVDRKGARLYEEPINLISQDAVRLSDFGAGFKPICWCIEPLIKYRPAISFTTNMMEVPPWQQLQNNSLLNPKLNWFCFCI